MKISFEQYENNCKQCDFTRRADQIKDGYNVTCGHEQFVGDVCEKKSDWRAAAKHDDVKADEPENVAAPFYGKGESRPLRVMISQPMKGRPDPAMKAERMKIEEWLFNQGYDVDIVNTHFYNYPEESQGVNTPLQYLSQALNVMAGCDEILFTPGCDAVVFAPGWEDARGCRIEHEAAVEYGLFVMEYRK